MGQVIEAVDFDFNTLLELGFRSSIEEVEVAAVRGSR